MLKFRKVPATKRSNLTYSMEPRNFEKVRFASLRRKIDPPFCAAHDSLSATFYQCWCHGNFTQDFQGYRPLEGASIQEAKALFDALHGLIFVLHQLALDNQNEKEGFPHLALKEQFDRIAAFSFKSKRDTLRDKVTSLKSEGISLNI